MKHLLSSVINWEIAVMFYEYLLDRTIPETEEALFPTKEWQAGNTKNFLMSQRRTPVLCQAPWNVAKLSSTGTKVLEKVWQKKGLNAASHTNVVIALVQERTREEMASQCWACEPADRGPCSQGGHTVSLGSSIPFVHCPILNGFHLGPLYSQNTIQPMCRSSHLDNWILRLYKTNIAYQI